MSKSISIIIPTYNSIKYIQYTIYSILSQTNCVKEIIIVDSGSTDGTIEFCKDKVDVILYHPPGNMYAAINEGIKTASNKVVTYINSDDCYYQNVLSGYLDFFHDNDLDFSYALGDFVDSNGKFRSSIYTPDVAEAKKYLESGLVTFIQPSAIFKKNVFDVLEGFNCNSLKYCADYDFYFRVFKSNFSIGFYKEWVVTFRVSDNQLSNANRNEMDNEAQSVLFTHSTTSNLSKIYFRFKFKIKNSLNIFFRILRSYQLTGKIKVIRALSPF